jgi:Tol biopolymer transport system component
VKVWGLVGLLAFALVVGAAARDGEAAYAGRNGSILFLRDLGGNAPPSPHIFLVQPDGSGLRDVTPPGYWDIRNAAWSPDGSRIAFSAFKEVTGPNPDLDSDIYVMNADGSGVRELTRTDIGEGDPTWSPDGRWLAFTSVHGGLITVFRMRADGSGRQRLSNQVVGCDSPRWAPRGGLIVFECELPGGLVIMRSDGSRERRLTSASRRTDYSPAWSPDGSAILFSRGAWTYRIRPDGGGLARVARVSGERAISPDGRWMALTRLIDHQQELWVVQRDGRGARRLTATPGLHEYGPDWQPLR